MSKSPGDGERFTVEQVIAALQATAGIATAAAAKLRCSQRTVYNYLERHEEVRAAIVEIRSANLDLAEAKLSELIRKGHPQSVMFYLRCMGKDRGWNERVETTGKDGAPLNMGSVTIFQLPDNGRATPPAAPDGGAS